MDVDDDVDDDIDSDDDDVESVSWPISVPPDDDEDDDVDSDDDDDDEEEEEAEGGRKFAKGSYGKGTLATGGASTYTLKSSCAR